MALSLVHGTTPAAPADAAGALADQASVLVRCAVTFDHTAHLVTDHALADRLTIEAARLRQTARRLMEQAARMGTPRTRAKAA
jgi:hypothetical protein